MSRQLSVLLTAAVLGALGIIAWVLSLAGSGLDLTDEGFYLNWIAQPESIPASVTLFGFFYHPVYELLQGHIVLLRGLNVIVSAVLSTLLAWSLLRQIAPASGALALRWTQVAIATSFAPMPLVFLGNWLMTPNYNALAIHALFVGAIGMVWLGLARRTWVAWIGAALVGLGGWAAFLAKPTTALVLAGAVIVVIATIRRERWMLLVAASAYATLLTIATGLAIDGSLRDFVQRLRWGADDAALLAGGHTLRDSFRIDIIEWDAATQQQFLYLFLIAFVIGLLVQVQRTSAVVTWVAGIAIPAATAAYLCGFIGADRVAVPFQTLLMGAVPMGVVVSLLVYRNRDELLPHRWRAWVLSALLLFMPLLLAFGTNNNYWHSGGLGGGFWVLALLTFLLALHRDDVRDTRLLILSALGAQAVIALLLHASANAPYRQTTPLRGMTTTTMVPMKTGTSLRVQADIGEQINRMQRAAKNGAMLRGTPVIDLTGRAPTLVYALDATPVGAAWILGGYPGSNSLAATMLARMPCKDIGAAWVIDEPGGPRSIDPSVLQTSGIMHDEDFEVLETVPFEGLNRRLLRPVRNSKDAAAACEYARAGSAAH